jgi:serine/threonine protein kinase
MFPGWPHPPYYATLGGDILEGLEHIKTTQRPLPHYVQELIFYLKRLTWSKFLETKRGSYKIMKESSDGVMNAFEIIDESKFQKRVKLYKRLKDIDEVMIPNEWYAYKLGDHVYTFSTFTLCGNGDLYMYFIHMDKSSCPRSDSFKKEIPEYIRLFKNLGRALLKCHALGVFLIDIKPENMLACQNKDGTPILKMIDVDDVILDAVVTSRLYENQYAPKGTRMPSVTADYSAQLYGMVDELGNSQKNRREVYEWIDWHAYSQTLLMCYPGMIGICDANSRNRFYNNQTMKQSVPQIQKMLATPELPLLVRKCAALIQRRVKKISTTVVRGDEIDVSYPASIELTMEENNFMRTFFEQKDEDRIHIDDEGALIELRPNEAVVLSSRQCLRF